MIIPVRARRSVFIAPTLLRIFILVILLLVSLGADARDRDHTGGWRLGLGHDHYGIYRWDGRGWRRMPGSATDVGDGWVIGTDHRSGGYGIYRWTGRSWQRMPGGAVRIGGTYDQPWVINDRGEQFFWGGYDWIETRGGRRGFVNRYREPIVEERPYAGRSDRRDHRGW